MSGNSEGNEPSAIARVPSFDGRIVHKVVLTGGPCAGKTTGQASLSSFFENMGWKVYRVPEAANTLLSGGVRFSELGPQDCFLFQENLLKTMMQIEQTYMSLAATCARNVLIICDRGTMDASAYLDPAGWAKILHNCNLNPIEIRDNRYNQIIHLVTAAKGAEQFYSLTNSTSRSEGVELACELDDKVLRAWVGHPYLEVLDNSTSFDMKIKRLIALVCNRLGLDTGDRLYPNSRKRKFLVKSLPPPEAFPKFEDFTVEHDYLLTNESGTQSRLRKRGWNGHWGYTHTTRRLVTTGEKVEHVEQRTQITERDYMMLILNRDPAHYRVYKRRRCFVWNNQYFQLDIYTEKNSAKYRGLMILETFTTRTDAVPLPDFLEVEKEITKDSTHSMFNLSKKSHPLPPPSPSTASSEKPSKSPTTFSKIEIPSDHSGSGVSFQSSTVEPPALQNGKIHPYRVNGVENHRTNSVSSLGDSPAHDHAKIRSISDAGANLHAHS